MEWRGRSNGQRGAGAGLDAHRPIALITGFAAGGSEVRKRFFLKKETKTLAFWRVAWIGGKPAKK
jgi:hypothetical protein